ncbi:MAG: YkgJ family cysteine cluster protein [Planctomycetaceae bacterium]
MQNWSCHNCGGCCRQHEIEITEAERQRILSQNWTPADGIPAGQPLFEWMAGPIWNKTYRLAFQPDGACVFLNEQGLCRIHAKFGEPAKPLACRVYPYAFHPAGKGATVSLRFSCPSVVANQGRSVTQQTGDLQQIARMVVPAGAEQLPAPKISRREQLSWPDFRRFIDALEASIAEETVPLAVRLNRILAWTSLVAEARFDKLNGARLNEFLQLIREAADQEVPGWPDVAVAPSKLGQSAFRTLAAIYARKDTATAVREGWRGRWKLFRAILRFVRGQGLIPVLQEGFREVPFHALEPPFGKTSPEIEALMTRYFQVKIRGLHFCGRGFYNFPFTDGVSYLVLMWPITLWLARWKAAGDQRTQLTLDDVSQALAVADHNQGFSPLLGQTNSLSRIRLLQHTGDLGRLCFWYAR